MPTFYIKASDRLPALQATLTDGNGAPVDLTTSTGVTFNMKNSAAALTINNGTCSYVGAQTTGQVSYAWAGGDTATPGTYMGEFVVTWPGGLQERFPNGDNIVVIILANLG